jgi:hypothetical protein
MSMPELWIGLVCLKPLNEKDFGAAGAYTNIVTWACNAQEFYEKAETLAASLDFYVMSTEGQERFSDRVARASVSDEIREMACYDPTTISPPAPVLRRVMEFRVR